MLAFLLNQHYACALVRSNEQHMLVAIENLHRMGLVYSLTLKP
jgi:hypothetical protein